MKKLSIVLCGILMFLLYSVPAWAVPAFVQAGHYSSECSSSTCNMTFNLENEPVTPGNMILVGVRTDNGGGGVSSVTTSQGDTCYQAIEQLDLYTNFWLEMWYCPDTVGGYTTVTVHLTGTIGNGNRMAMAEFSGVATVSPVHGTPVSDSDEGSTADAGDLTTTISDALLVVWAGCNGNNDFGPDSVPPPGWSKPYLGPDPGDGADKYAMAYYVASSPGTYDAYLENANDYWSAAAVAFIPEDSEPPPPSGELVQSTKTTGGATGLSTSLTFPSNVSPESLIVATARLSNGANATCSDNQGGSYTTHIYNPHSLGWSQVICSAPNAAGGPTTVTMTSTGGTTVWRMQIAEFSDVATSNHVLDISYATGTSGGANPGTVDTGEDNTVIYTSACSDEDSWSPADTSGFSVTPDYTKIENAEMRNVAGYKTIDAGTYGASFSGTDAWAAGIIAFAPYGIVSDTTPPTLSSFVIPWQGTTAVATFSETVTESGSGSDWSFTMSGGAVTLSSPSINGNVITYTTSRTIAYNETLSSLSYTQPGNGIEDIANNDLATIADASDEFTNNSTSGSGLIYHWVSTSGGAAWSSCVGASDPSIYCSLATANSNLSASYGQNIVYLLAGTYNNSGERINPSNNGSATYKLQYIAYGGTVTITGAACDTSSEEAVNIDNRDYIVVDGISTSGCYHHLWMDNGSSYNEIKNCSFDSNDNQDWHHSVIRGGSQYNWIHDTQFSKGGDPDDGGDDSGSVLDLGNESADNDDETWYNLIEDCTFFHGGHHVFALMSSYNTIRNNYFHNEAWGGTPYGNRVLYGNSPADAPGRNVLEGNRWGYSWESTDDGPVGNVVVLSPNNIFRYNSIYHSYGYGFALAGYDTYSVADDNRIYNNTIFNNGLGNQTGDFEAAVFVTDQAGQMPEGNIFKNNLYYNQTYNYRGDWEDQTYVNDYLGDEEGNPLFTNASTTPPADKTDDTLPDLTLQSGSPAIDFGGELTAVAVADSGSGTTLIVDDASYFQDGSFAPSGTVDADWISIGTTANNVQISSINYSTNTITLANTISRMDYMSVWLYKKSDGEIVCYGDYQDAGAYEYTGEGDVTPPEVSSATIQTNGTHLYIYFNESVTVNNSTGFSLSGTDLGQDISSCDTNSSPMDCTLDAKVLYNDTGITLNYSGAPANAIEDTSGNDLADFSGESVTNNSTGISAPTGFVIGSGASTLSNIGSGATTVTVIE